MSIKYDQINGSYAKPKYECDELESFGKDIRDLDNERSFMIEPLLRAKSV